MPTLLYNSADTLYAGTLTGRVLIGRRLSQGVILNDPSVSRLHAWIDSTANDGARWIITDAGSKAGTFVNDQQIYQHELHDEDVIRVGDVQIRYHTQNILPLNAIPVNFSVSVNDGPTTGILFNCACGAPIWVVNDLAGKKGICRHCKKPVLVPDASPAIAPAVVRIAPPTTPPVAAPSPVKPEAAPAKRPARCAVCHSEIAPGEDKTTCPDCAMQFHTACWQENFGCSSYGCPQVNSLEFHPVPMKSPMTIEAAFVGSGRAIDESGAKSSTLLELIAIAAGVVASILGSVAFGIPAVLVAIWTIVLMLRGRRKSLLLIPLLICLAGIAAGLAVSDIWYFGGRHLLRIH